jgi:hypothetical protein
MLTLTHIHGRSVASRKAMMDRQNTMVIGSYMNNDNSKGNQESDQNRNTSGSNVKSTRGLRGLCRSWTVGRSLGAFACMIYLVWMTTGVLFYHYFNDFEFSTAFYYAIEAGMSIGTD